MKKNIVIRLFVGLSILSTATLLSAATQPKFSLIPATLTTVVLPVNGQTTVQYKVTNNTKVTRTLTMVPIKGITQSISQSGSCANPFTLSHNESCFLNLPLIGTQITERVLGGPKICKTKGPGDNTPDPFLCSQPSEINSLNITSVGIQEAIISVSPSVQQMFVGGPPVTLIVTNYSTTVTAQNITLSLPSTWTDVHQDSSSCVSVAPGKTCMLIFMPGATTAHPNPQVNPIQGSNTNQATATLSVQNVNLTVAPPSLTIQTNTSATGILSVTNQNSSVIANSVAVTFPLAWNAKVTASGCSTIAAGVTCDITLTVASPYVNQAFQAVAIQGSNTTTATSSVSVVGGSSGLSLEPNSLVLAAGDRGGVAKTITVKNTGPNSVTNINTNFSSPSAVTVSSTCSSLLNTGDTCVFTFTPVASGTWIDQFAPTSFNITGISSGNTITAPASILVLDYQSLYQGGYLFSIDPTGTIGAVLSISDNQSFVLQWSYLAGITGANSYYLGSNNTAAMINHPEVDAAAAEICVGYSSTPSGATCSGVELCYNDWYLPAICEMGPDSSDNFICNNSTQNIADSLPTFLGCTSSFCLQNFYWSSTEYALGAANQAWEQSYSGYAGISQGVAGKSNTLNIRCIRHLT